MITAEQLKDIRERVEALNRYLSIDAKRIEWEEEQLRTQAPGFWDDPKAAEAQMKKVKNTKISVEDLAHMMNPATRIMKNISE